MISQKIRTYFTIPHGSRILGSINTYWIQHSCNISEVKTIVYECKLWKKKKTYTQIDAISVYSLLFASINIQGRK